jgi:predicted TIM-barrel fold metal-dependent hydrolase
MFIGVCTINPLKYKPEELVKIEEDIKKGIFKAIKLFPGYEYFFPNQKECNPVYELAEKLKVPVLFHTGDTNDPKSKVKYAHPLNVDDVAVSFPKVNFVLCHLGNPWIMDAVEVLYKNKNAYADLSGFVAGKGDLIFKKYYKGRQKAMMEGIFYEFSNVEKLMFGTDYPLTNYEFYIKFIKKLKLSNKEFNKIFFETAAKLFKV